MYIMKATYLTPSGKELTREKRVKSLLELEENVRIMRATGYTPVTIKVQGVPGKQEVKTLTQL